MIRARTHILVFMVAAAVSALLSSCDSVQPGAKDSLVVEAFFRVGERPSPVRLRTTVPIASGVRSANGSVAPGARVDVQVNDERTRYREIAPGLYAPPDEYTRILEPGDVFRLTAEWAGEIATASGIIPPPIRLDSLMVSAPTVPVEAVLLDSLRLDTLGVDARTGFIYPVETTVWWTSKSEADPETWVQAQLKPRREFSSVVVDFFLLPEDVFREADVQTGEGSAVSWTGLYAVPVESASDPVPVHELRVALVRSDRAYADFAIARSDAGSREPPTNVEGGLGIAVGLSVDSVTVEVDPAVVRRKSIVFGR